MSNIWDKLAEGVSTTAYMQGMDSHLNGEKFKTMQELTDSYRNKNAIQLPILAGTKVAFIGFLESYMSYENPPSNGMVGEVVSAKSANGDVTSHEGKVFVKFEDGVARSIFAQHLMLAGCEKLPEGPMRENCEKAKEEGVAKEKKKAQDKTARLMKRQIKILEKFANFFIENPDYMPTFFNGLPSKVRDQLRKVKDQETLPMDAERWLRDWQTEQKMSRRFANENTFVVASLGDLTNFLRVANNTLIHKATKDLWSFEKDADGKFTVERLYDDNGNPLKL